METQQEIFARLDRICEDHKRTLQMLYEDGGKNAIVAYFSAMCVAVSAVFVVNNDWELGTELSQVCSTTALAITTKLHSK
jgi:hypothetical protein